jgi:L-amino acid N-acyltransferase YncA
MTFFIRSVQEGDTDSTLAVLNPLIRAGMYSTMAEELSVAEQADFIRSFPAQGVFNVAVERGSERLLGLQDVVPIPHTDGGYGHTGEISTFVALTSQRMGIGGSLNRTTFQAAGALGFERLRATIRADNSGAIAFYQKQGFNVEAGFKESIWIRGRRVEIIVAEKTLV